MLNELHQLSNALLESEISPESWHPKYPSIPIIKPNAPCVRIVLEGHKVAMLEQLSPERGRFVRKYGNNQASFPAMNLAPLYCISENEPTNMIRTWIKDKGESIDLQQVKSFCTTNNWGGKFAQKYKLQTKKRPEELIQFLGNENKFEPLMELIQALEPFKSPEHLHKALEEAVFQMIKSKRDISLALQILFYKKTEKDKKKDPAEDNFGTLSVVFDTFDLEDAGFSTAGPKFTTGLNAALLRAESAEKDIDTVTELDAYGLPFSPLDEPMPQVKLPAGFTVSLRTMSSNEPCQHRYSRIENGSYPISRKKRAELKASLEWLSGEEMKNKTWVSLGKDEALFVYPSRLPDQIPELARTYNRAEKTASFEAEAKYFSEFVTKTKRLDPEHYPDLRQHRAIDLQR